MTSPQSMRFSSPARVVAGLVLRCATVFGSTEQAGIWLNEPLEALQRETPMSLLEKGEYERFEELLNHIEHGIFA